MVSVPIFPPKAIAFFRTDSVFSSLQPVVYPAGKHATAVRRACFLTGGMVPGVAEWGVVLGGCFGSMFSSLRSAGGLLRLGEHPQPSSPLASPCQARPCGPTSPSRERGFEDCGAWKERSFGVRRALAAFTHRGATTTTENRPPSPPFRSPRARHFYAAITA